MIDNLNKNYGDIFEAALIQEIASVATYREVSEGQVLIDIGSYLKAMPILISGAIKIMREDENGDELLLYYIESGDTCSISMTNCIGGKRSEIKAVAEVETKLLMIPLEKVEEWAGKYKTWLRFIMDSYHNRINELFHTIDSIAFSNMDQRIIEYLTEKARVTSDKVIHATHQEIAFDLHSSRVVISRLLKKLENTGAIVLHRNHLEIIDL